MGIQRWSKNTRVVLCGVFLLAGFFAESLAAENENISMDPFQGRCLKIEEIPVSQRDALPVIDDYGKVRRRLIDRAAEQAVEQVVGLEIASSREIKTALHNEVADSRYNEEVTGGSGGLVRPKIEKEEVIDVGGNKFLSLVLNISVCIPKTPKTPPVQITGVPQAFFDPLTGEPKVWFWQSKAGDFEFFDGEGFHPRTGDVLKPVTREVVGELQAQLDKRQAIEDEKARQIAEEHAKFQRQEQQAGRCDELAANPEDIQRPSGVVGVSYAILKLHIDEAITACRGAIAKSPDEGRYYYQLGRALQAGKKNSEAAKYLNKALGLNHIAAYDNLGQLTDNRSLFERGVAAGDPSSMVSLAWRLEPKVWRPENYALQIQRSLALYKRAAELGHVAARERYEELKQEIEAQKVDAESKRQQQEQGMKIMQNVLGGVFSKIGN